MLLFGAAPARAEVTAPPDWDPALASAVLTTALAFMAPRTLEPVPVPQLTLWGLRGLTALDPTLTVELRDGQLALRLASRVVATAAPPRPDSIQDWADLAVAMAAASRDISMAIRHAGTAGLVRSFFDELFNHLDTFSRYVPPGEADDDRARRTGRAGAGITLLSRGGAVFVAAVAADGPGALAGVRPGDRVLAVEDQPVAGQSAAVVFGWIAGPEGTTVQLSLRSRDAPARSVAVLRALVPPESVFVERRGGILLLRVTGFNSGTDARLSHELERGTARRVAVGARSVTRGPATGGPPSGIVIDLRGNRGGLVREAVAVADELLAVTRNARRPQNRLAVAAGVLAVVSTGFLVTAVGRDPRANRIWRSGGTELAGGLPVVVMVDGRSASAAEIVAAALADRGRAVVVGSVTQGKGLVQAIAPLPDGGELFVTWSRLLAPLGWPIQGLGVLPQVCTSTGIDRLQLQLANLAAGNQLMAADLARQHEARAPIPIAQMLALRGACPAAEGRDGDLEAAKFLIGHPAAYATALLPPFTGLTSP